MANTEGMSDEAVASLLTPESASTTKTKSAFALRQERMRKRMNEPMGERPAATVIRPSPPSNRVQANNDIDASDELKEQEDSQVSAKEAAPPPILKAVVERDVAPNHAKHSLSSGTIRKSHFASQQKKSSGGFPSVHMPIGTFINKGAPPKERKNRPNVAPQTKRQVPPIAQLDPVQRDSQALLDQMTPEEIHDQAQELKSSLSPDLVAFLQKRGREKGKAAEPGSNATNIIPTEQEPKEKESIRGTLIPLDDVEEKNRVASLLSSVKTPEDLDAVYAQEMGIADGDAEDDNPVEDDFTTACNLLRSTSPRQALWAARVVCQRLEADIAAGKSFAINSDDKNAWPYPTVLAVSLRCLLDSPLSQSNGYLLHAYILRSLYALLKLRAHSNHVVDVTCNFDTDASIFQEYFMDDAVPSPPFGSCYPSVSVQPVASTKEGDAVAYSTLSSSTSAQQDGQAFGKDPMWTLLTRMRILPRLADLLSVNLSDEALVAICGILSMLSVRSTGTASAIAQHSTILQSLLKVTVLPPMDDESDTSLYPGLFNTRVALPAVVFLCTLARQSRIAASAIRVDSIVPPIVAMKAESDKENALQKWSLILWRTVLRYGLGLSSLHTFVTLSIPHLASGQSTEYSLATEFLSAFTNVCYCVRVAKSKPVAEWKSVMSFEASESLATALNLLATSARQAIHHVRDVESFSKASDMCLMAARLRFLQSYLAAIEQEYPQGSDESQLDGDHTMDLDELAFALQNISKRADTEKTLQMVPSCGSDLCVLDANDGWVDVVSTRQEASACAFFDSLASILHTISIHYTSQQVNGQSQDNVSSLFSKFVATFANWMKMPPPPSAATDSQPNVSLARRKWLNAMAFHVVRFTLDDMNQNESSTNSTALEPRRSFAFSLVGRLQLGEESFAAILFSEDMLFRTSNQSSLKASPVSSLLIQELCATSLARQQLDHSFKLHYGFGITATEWGPFHIGTLLSETDSQDPRSSTPFSELLIPIGPLWLWKILSGATNQTEAIRGTQPGDETEVLASCLKLLVALENTPTSLSMSYAKQVPSGAKLYYLMNVFLHSEDVLRDDRIGPLLEMLFDRYTTEQDQGVPLVDSFWRACFDHSQISQRNASGESNDMDTKERQLFSMLMGRQDVSERQLRPLIDFVADVCKVYLEYGAQYESFTKCIRMFLSITFPSQARCEAIRSLREVLHLLTLSKEEDEPFGVDMSTALDACLIGNTTNTGEAARDSSEFLDLLASVMKVDKAGRADSSKWSAERGGFFFFFAVASLARNLATTVQGGTGEGIARQRLGNLSNESKDIVLDSADRLILDGVNLVSTVMDVVKGHHLRARGRI